VVTSLRARVQARTAGLALAAATVAFLLTLLLVAEDTAFVSGDGPGQSALDSLAATVGLLLAFLFLGRFQESRLQGDALLCAALASLSCGNAVFSVVPQVAGSGHPLSTASAYSGLWACGLFAAAVWSPAEVVDVMRRRQVPRAIAGTVLVVLGTSWLLSDLLPRGTGSSADTFGTAGGGLLRTVQVLAALALLGAAVGWCRPSAQGDGMARSLAVAAVLGAGSRLDFAVGGGPGSSWASAGTLLRLGFYGTLVVAAVVEIRGYWRRVAQVAVLEERRRIARDLHDGPVQTLAGVAYTVAAAGERLPEGDRARKPIAAAADALRETIRELRTLLVEVHPPSLHQAGLEAALDDAVGPLRHEGVQVDVAVGAGSMRPEAEAVVFRAAQEALRNARTHAGAEHVTVTVETASGRAHLRVSDDGRGFDPAGPAPDKHLGLELLGELVRDAGGTLAVDSRPGTGTTVRVEVPA